MHLLKYEGWKSLNEQDNSVPDEIYFKIPIDYDHSENDKKVYNQLTNLIERLGEQFKVELSESNIKTTSFILTFNGYKTENDFLSDFVETHPFSIILNTRGKHPSSKMVHNTKYQYYPDSLIAELSRYSSNAVFYLYGSKEDISKKLPATIKIKKEALISNLEELSNKVKKILINSINLDSIRHISDDKEKNINLIEEKISNTLIEKNYTEEVYKTKSQEVAELIIAYLIYENNKNRILETEFIAEPVYYSKLSSELESDISPYLQIDYSSLSNMEFTNLVKTKIKPIVVNILKYVSRGGDEMKIASKYLAKLVKAIGLNAYTKLINKE